MQLLRREGPVHRLQGGFAPAPVHLRARQDPPPPGHRHLRPPPAPADGRPQARPPDRTDPIHQRPPLGHRMTEQLRIPGPTPLPDRVIRAMSRPMIDHWGPEFEAMHREISAGVREVFGTTEADLLIISSSGTGSMESAVANLVSPGDQVVVCTCGVFGDRFADINAAYGAEVIKLAVDWGQPIEPHRLADVLAANPGAGVVFLTHNETSTGVTNQVAALARVAREAGRLVVVDAISSASSMPLAMDAWGLDVVLSGSQKGWMAPPGIAFAAVGPRAWQDVLPARSPRFYFDWY